MLRAKIKQGREYAVCVLLFWSMCWTFTICPSLSTLYLVADICEQYEGAPLPWLPVGHGWWEAPSGDWRAECKWGQLSLFLLQRPLPLSGGFSYTAHPSPRISPFPCCFRPRDGNHGYLYYPRGDSLPLLVSFYHVHTFISSTLIDSPRMVPTGSCHLEEGLAEMVSFR